MNMPDQGPAVRQLFGSDADAYDARQYGVGHRTLIADRQRLVSRLLRDLSLPAGARLLDVACGPGHLLVDARSLGLVVAGLDSSAAMLRAARTRLQPAACLVRGDALALPFQSQMFDVVTCSGLIEYVPDPSPLLRELFRVLKPGHRALVASTNRLSPALILAPFANALRRSTFLKRALRVLRLPFDDMSLRERPFRLTFHTTGKLSSLLRGAGFETPAMYFFHVQFIPHPFDRLVPAAGNACVALMDHLQFLPPVRMAAEGLLAVARRPA